MPLLTSRVTETYRRYYRSVEPIVKRKKTRSYSTAIFFFLVVALFGWYAIKPTVQTILYLQREIKDKSAVNAKMDEKINALIDAQAAYEAVTEKLTFLTQAVPDVSDAVKLASYIQTLSAESSASVSAIQIPTVPLLGQSATPTGGKAVVRKLTEFPISVTIEGTFPAIRTFLNKLTSLRRLVSIESVSFNSIKDVTRPVGAQHVRVVMRVASFYYQL